jgi:hypothetical protein
MEIGLPEPAYAVISSGGWYLPVQPPSPKPMADNARRVKFTEFSQNRTFKSV